MTRFSPSPTGYLHIGGLFGALVDFLTARVSGGLTYLRIEDTDKKREVADGVSAIINGFKNFGLEFDEGVTGFDTEKGAYGPYTQSKRVEIYHAVAKRLVQEGKAYPCFCTGGRARRYPRRAGKRRRGDNRIFRQMGEVPRPEL